MNKAKRTISRIAKSLTIVVPTRTLRSRTREVIAKQLLRIALNGQKDTLLFKYLQRAITLSQAYTYQGGFGVRLPDTKEDIFNISGQNQLKSIHGGGGGTILDFYERYDCDKLELVLNLFDDEYSRIAFVSALLRRSSNYHQGILLVHFYEHIWKYYYELLDCIDSKDSIQAGGEAWNFVDLCRFKSMRFGNTRMYYNANGVFATFILEQYAYRHIISVEPGDHVVDGGACFGDTALYFAHKVGSQGKVYAFEFNQESLNVFHKNMALNPHVNNIALLEYPLYKDSQTHVYCEGGVGSSRINTEKEGGQDYVVTASIDDLVANGKIERIDFIKMDIEGSELNALMGAKNSILKFQPKLAICLYHNDVDYHEIPLYLKELVPHYEFYCDHFTLGAWETILFGKPRK